MLRRSRQIVSASRTFCAPIVRSLLLGVALDDPDVTAGQAACAVDKAMGPLDDDHIVQVLNATSQNDPAVHQVLTDINSFAQSCR